MDDFSNNIPPSSSHGGRNIAIVGGAVLIIIVGFLVLKYWSKLTSVSPFGTGQEAPQKIYTPAEKAQLLRSLQQTSSTTGAQSPPITPAAKAQLLQQVSTQNSAQPAPQPSTAEKMKLLQSLQH